MGRLKTLIAAGLGLAMSGTFAAAADMPGYPVPVFSDGGSFARWDGFNFGAQAGIMNMNANFGNSTSSLIAFILRNTTLQNEFQPSSWTTLPSTTTGGDQFGAFVGYNFQWDQLVIGFDLAYNRTSSLEASASDTIARQVVTSDGVNHQVTIVAQSSIKLIDYATLRARGAYAFGRSALCLYRRSRRPLRLCDHRNGN